MTDSVREQLVESPPETVRDRWPSSVAVIAVVMHAVAGLMLVGWYYMIVPRWKGELHGLSVRVELTQSATLLFYQSDMIVNYWYVGVPFVVPILIGDFRAIRWMARRSGVLVAVFIALCIMLSMLGYIAFGEYILHQARLIAKAIVSSRGP